MVVPSALTLLCPGFNNILKLLLLLKCFMKAKMFTLPSLPISKHIIICISANNKCPALFSMELESIALSSDFSLSHHKVSSWSDNFGGKIATFEL